MYVILSNKMILIATSVEVIISITQKKFRSDFKSYPRISAFRQSITKLFQTFARKSRARQNADG